MLKDMMTKSDEFENYYEARVSIHKTMAEYMRLVTRSDENLPYMTARLASFGVLVALALSLLFALISTSPWPTAGIWPIALMAGLFLYSQRGRDAQRTHQVEGDIRKATQTAMLLGALPGTPHDRFRDDNQARVHMRGFHKALDIPLPRRYFLGMMLYCFGIAGIAYVATMSFFVDGSMETFSWIVAAQCLCAVPGFIMHRADRRALARTAELRADAAAFHLAEFGLTFDGKSEIFDEKDSQG